jgi:hypothetical protein
MGALNLLVEQYGRMRLRYKYNTEASLLILLTCVYSEVHTHTCASIPKLLFQLVLTSVPTLFLSYAAHLVSSIANFYSLRLSSSIRLLYQPAFRSEQLTSAELLTYFVRHSYPLSGIRAS